MAFSDKYKQDKLKSMAANARRILGESGVFSEQETDFIMQINEMVMGVDGTAEGWGGYSYDPADYIDTSVEIFKMSRSFFKTKTLEESLVTREKAEQAAKK